MPTTEQRKENQEFSGANAVRFIFYTFLSFVEQIVKHDLNYVKTHLGNLKYCIEAERTSVAPFPIGLCTLTRNYSGTLCRGITFCLEL
jgi:hypothetical protein